MTIHEEPDNREDMTDPWLGAPPGLLRVSERIHDDILAHLRGALPHEGVGLLAVHGLATGRGVLDVTRFYAGTNAEASASRFTMDPTEVIAAFRDIDERGWRLGAIVHSHPHGPAVPSPADLREAHYPDALMVIVSLAAPGPEIGAWWIGSPGERLVPVRVPVEVR